MTIKSIYFLMFTMTFALFAQSALASNFKDKTRVNKSKKMVSENDLQLSQHEISELNQILSCTSDEDCEVLGVGYKECGGPDSYIVTSRKNVNFQKLLEAIKIYFEQDRNYSIQHQLGSPCDVTRQPYGSCQKNICQPVFPTMVEYVIHSIPPGASISIETRLQSAEELKKIWRKNPYPSLQEPPVIDFSKNDLIPWNFCQREANKIFYYRLARVGDVGTKLIVNYRKFNSCQLVDPNTCEIQFATIPKKQSEIKVKEQKQNCGEIKK